ncbi:hypothetical protein [Escherichia coli]
MPALSPCQEGARCEEETTCPQAQASSVLLARHNVCCQTPRPVLA